MKQEFKVTPFSVLNKGPRISDWKKCDGYDSAIGVIMTADKDITFDCALMLRPHDPNQMCCEVQAVFSILNQRPTLQPIVLNKGTVHIGAYRQVSSVNEMQAQQIQNACVNDTICFQVTWSSYMGDISYGDPKRDPPLKTPAVPTSEFFMNSHLSDVKFIVGAKQYEVTANKTILALRSPVFKAMFFGALPEVGTIEIPDVEVIPFYSLLRYIYCLEGVIDKAWVRETLYAADKYEVPDLKQAVALLLDEERIYEVLEYISSTASLTDIDGRVESFVMKIEFLNSDVFLTLSPSSIEWVVDIDGWKVDELKLWNRCVEWANVQSRNEGVDEPSAHDLRNEMLPFLKFFRLPLIPVADFAAGPADSGILTFAETQDVYKFHLCQAEPKIFKLKR